MIIVNYTDGSQEKFETIGEAEAGIIETVVGCNFAAIVESMEDEEGRELFLEWSVTIRA